MPIWGGCFRFAEALRLAAFVIDSMSPAAIVLRVCRLDLVNRQLSQLALDRDRAHDLGEHLATARAGAERVIALVRECAGSLDRAPEGPSPALPGTLPPVVIDARSVNDGARGLDVSTAAAAITGAFLILARVLRRRDLGSAARRVRLVACV